MAAIIGNTVNQSKTATCGPVLTDLYREVVALEVDCYALVASCV